MPALLYQPCSNFISCLTVLFLTQVSSCVSRSVPLVSLNLEQVLSLLAFHDLDTLGEYWPETIPQFGSV